MTTTLCKAVHRGVVGVVVVVAAAAAAACGWWQVVETSQDGAAIHWCHRDVWNEQQLFLDHVQSMFWPGDSWHMIDIGAVGHLLALRRLVVILHHSMHTSVESLLDNVYIPSLTHIRDNMHCKHVQIFVGVVNSGNQQPHFT